jgi:hypothetical protein
MAGVLAAREGDDEAPALGVHVNPAPVVTELGAVTPAGREGADRYHVPERASPGRGSQPRPHEQVRQATSPASVAGFAGSPFLERALLAQFLDMLTTLNVGRAWGPQSFCNGPGCQRARHGAFLRRRTHSCMKGGPSVAGSR